MSGLTTALIFFLVVVPLTLLGFQYGGRYVYWYRLTDRSILVVLFGVVPIGRIRYERITGIRGGSFWDVGFEPFMVRFGNRIWGSIVLISRRYWLPIVITPDEADEFVEEVRWRIHRETGRWLEPGPPP